MGLRKLFARAVRSRKAPRLEVPPAPRPSQIAEAVAGLPRELKKAQKMEVRRMYRFRPFRGIVDSRTRQILAEGGARANFERIEAEAKRQAEEDALYGIAPAAQ